MSSGVAVYVVVAAGSSVAAGTAEVASVLDRYASANAHVFVAENGRAEGAKAKGEGEGKARAAMGGADRLDAVRLAVAANFWCCHFQRPIMYFSVVE